MININIPEQFYGALTNHNSSEMIKLYHDDVIFTDPAFGMLQGIRAKKMWEMLLANSKSDLNIQYEILDSSNEQATVSWIAKYKFGPQRRLVENHVIASLKIKQGKIVEHHDTFNMWKWSSQALGLSGRLLGWTGFMKKKVQLKTNRALDKYMKEMTNLK